MSTVAIIPARGGSVRIPRKNIKDFHGKPIIAYSISSARESGLFDEIYVSTEDAEIADVARKYCAKVLDRPKDLCNDEYGPLDVARYHINTMPDVGKVCVIYATAPLMSVLDLNRGLFTLGRNETMYSFSAGNPPLHDAAQFFWCERAALMSRLPEFAHWTEMVPIAPERDCDINTQEDWARAEKMYAKLCS